MKRSCFDAMQTPSRSLGPVRRIARIARTAACAALVFAFGGCNMLLENEPGRLRSDDGETLPAAPAGERTGAGRDAGASASDASSTEDTSPPRPPQCTAGKKLCAGGCVSTEDAAFGCGGATCDRCALANAVAACKGGACAIGSCAPGWADCNGMAADGCETDLSLPASCGACAQACPASAPNADVACMAGACTLQCAAGTGDCNADPSDGCEKNLRKDKHNCGQCGRVCLIGSCDEGICRWSF